MHFCQHAAKHTCTFASGSEQPLGKRRAAALDHNVLSHGPGDVWTADVAETWPLVGPACYCGKVMLHTWKVAAG